MKKVIFWLHLTAGCIAGVIILIMCVTGVLMTYEKQMISWVDRDMRSTPPAGASPLTLETLAAKIEKPATFTFHAEAEAPVEAGYGRDRNVYLDAYTGKVLGEGSKGVRAFFGSVENWHRWLAFGGEARSTGRAITGAANLAFVFLVTSGLVLWLPKKWTRDRVKRGLIPRWNLTGRPRDWNWHNAFGIWSAVPLFFIVLTGVVMSYPWANDLLYKLAGSQQAPQQQGERRGGNGPGNGRAVATRTAGMDRLVAVAKEKAPDWQTLTVRLPSLTARSATISILRGSVGRPDLRSQLTLDVETASVTNWERFEDYNAGRKLRGYGRFLHTGELGGLAGQTVAGLASFGGAMLVWTGIALALRRLAKFRAKRAVPVSSEFQTTLR